MQVVIKRGNNVIKTTGGEGPVKEETASIQKTETVDNSNETGALKISVGYKPVKERKNPNYKGNGNKPTRNTSLRQVERTNGVNNRGIVRSSGDTKPRRETRPDNTALYEEIDKLKAKVSTLEDEKLDLHDTITKLEANNAGTERELADVKADLDQAYKDVDEIEANYNAVKKELDSVKADLQAAEAVISTSDEKGMEIESLRQELEVSNNQIKELEEKLKASTEGTDVELALKNLQETTEKYNECRDELDAKEDELDELKKKLEELNSEDKGVKLPLNPNDFSSEDANYVDEVMNAAGISPFIGELTTVNALNLKSGAELIDNDQYVVVITTSDGEALTDQDGNKVCIYCVNNVHINELFHDERLINETANQVKLLKVNKGE